MSRWKEMIMAKHKRRKAKNQRAGCLMCKPHKANGVRKRGKVTNGWGGVARTWRQEYRAWLSEKEWKKEW